MVGKKHKTRAHARMENLLRIFTVAESPNSTLGKIDQEITQNLASFLSERIVATEEDLEGIEKSFSNAQIPENPSYVSDYTDFIMEHLVAQSVHTAAPGFIGHMTTALPNFMLPLSRIMTALNQNLVKIETSKAFTPMERQVLSMLHNLVYDRDEAYYDQWMHNAESAVGAFCSGGTIANITALWVARNKAFPAVEGFRGVAREGLHKALKFYGFEDVAVLVSHRGHYSLGKAVDLLGLGRDSLVSVPTDANNRIDMSELQRMCASLRAKGTCIISIVGIAGTTETGSVDPLDEMADLCDALDVHFHIDAAWGGPTLFSKKYKHLLRGIERADSVTMDAHKQMYVPMGAGMVLFKNPAALSNIEHHAEYILRKGSKDLGSHTLEGSRPGIAMLVHAAMNIIAKRGYALLIDQGIEKACLFAELIDQRADFEVITYPELNLLTYRYVPAWLQSAMLEVGEADCAIINTQLDRINRRIQKLQRAAGRHFVSRTRLSAPRYHDHELTVLRVVIANPLTEEINLVSVLDEQQGFALKDKKLGAMIQDLEIFRQSEAEAVQAG